MKESVFVPLKEAIPRQYKSKYKRQYDQFRRFVAEPLIRFRRFSLNFRELPPLVNPIFMVGTAKGGTTLLANCMGHHPNICHPTYAHFELSPEWCKLADIDIAALATHKQNCPPLRAEDVTDTIRQNVREGFARLMVEEGGSKNTRFFNKSPHLWNKLPFVHSIFPDAHLLVSSRDIVSSVASLKETWAKQHKLTGVKYYFPIDGKHCWSSIWPNSSAQIEPERTFPGGEVSVLAEYWLRVYTTIEENAPQFDVVFPVHSRDFAENPGLVVSQVHKALNLPDVDYSLPTRLKPSKNQRWREMLTQQEQESLKAFIEANYNQITSLKYADTTVAL
ncbi:MAG: sulfotransferase [Coleofasciculus sp. B1-GNL1-01]|uniref:sulfotransferase n=1 Tax=Coleofasciculus sp. B1-GNL1-01 TaxID=3068484 RepID=UPI0032FAA19C